jgi:hypothetical protein
MDMTNDNPGGGEPRPRADEVALELMKQLITLASGVLALSATFVEKLQLVPVYLPIILALSWGALVLSVFGGLQAISAIVKSRLDPEESDWSEGYGKVRARIAKYAFIVGISLFAVVALGSLLQMRWSQKTEKEIQINVRECEDTSTASSERGAANSSAPPDANRAAHGRRR